VRRETVEVVIGIGWSLWWGELCEVLSHRGEEMTIDYWRMKNAKVNTPRAGHFAFFILHF
jgi:hypothetical protein